MEFSIFFFWCINFKIVARVLYIKLILLHYGSVPSWHDLCQFSCPGSQNPVFCPVVRFFKKYIFEIYMLWGVSGCKNFPGQNLSGKNFCIQKLLIICRFQICTFWKTGLPDKKPDSGIRDMKIGKNHVWMVQNHIAKELWW